jgi:hypothetical protein
MLASRGAPLRVAVRVRRAWPGLRLRTTALDAWDRGPRNDGAHPLRSFAPSVSRTRKFQWCRRGDPFLGDVRGWLSLQRRIRRPSWFRHQARFLPGKNATSPVTSGQYPVVGVGPWPGLDSMELALSLSLGHTRPGSAAAWIFFLFEFHRENRGGGMKAKQGQQQNCKRR